ncbi:hypothetical protein ZWY2020_046761 [Hordeum vulgare]|nr:hypothetical protein ZWY2020_046761 [Hordeum vulgare]
MRPQSCARAHRLLQPRRLTPALLGSLVLSSRRHDGSGHPQPLSSTGCPDTVNPLCWAAPPTRSELLHMGASASNPIDLDDEPDVFETALAYSL